MEWLQAKTSLNPVLMVTKSIVGYQERFNEWGKGVDTFWVASSRKNVPRVLLPAQRMPSQP